MAARGCPTSTVVSDRVVTVPNLISALRLVCVPLFGYLIVIGADAAALGVLVFAGVSDYADGVLARRWDQVTRLGQLLDPAADRLYVGVALLGLAWRDVLPWALVLAVVLRDVLLTLNVGLLRQAGFSSLPVHRVGKVATFVLLLALPLLLLSETVDAWRVALLPMAWAVTLWGVGLYWWAGVGYLAHTYRLLAGDLRSVQAENPEPTDG